MAFENHSLSYLTFRWNSFEVVFLFQMGYFIVSVLITDVGRRVDFCVIYSTGVHLNKSNKRLSR